LQTVTLIQCPQGLGGSIFTWDNFNRVFNRMAGFGFGASTIGMFARVGGGVFTKVRARRQL
jgi:Na+/H+-translocating membrane pyrophosphatase